MDIPGRTICRKNKELFEMQVYIAFQGSKEIERSEAIKTFIESVNSRYMNQYAKKIPEIPKILYFAYMVENYTVPNGLYQYPVALDYETVDLVTIDFKKINEICIVGNETEKRLRILRSILISMKENLKRREIKAFIVDNVERLLIQKEKESYVKSYTIDYSKVGEYLAEIITEFERRYELLMTSGIQAVEKLPLYLIIINNRDAIDYISATSNILDMYNQLTKKYKTLGICIMCSDVDDMAVLYGASELLKRFKENKKVFIATQNLKEFKFCELPPGYARTSKELMDGDAYWLNGISIQRVKLIDA